VELSQDVAEPQRDTDDRVGRLHSAIGRLPEIYREPILLYYLNGHSCTSVAKSLGLSESAVRSRLSRARLQLHEMLSEDSL
jgi:RNA polymerase sigma-70 factor (ECF subfamily)